MLSLALAAALAAAAPAGGHMVRAQDPQTIVAALQAGGYQAQLGTDEEGDPMVTSGAAGTKFQIFFYNCTNHRDCRTIQFYSGYHLEKAPSAETMNAFNQANRFGRAYLDKVNDPVIRMDLDLDAGGLSDPLFIDNVEIWAALIGQFERHIGYRG